MGQNEIHVNDIGTVFTMTIKDSNTAMDVSLADTTTSRVLYFKDPDGNVNTQTASFSGTGSDGVLVFTTTTALFNTAGAWNLQAKLIFGTTGSTFFTDVYEFKVYENLG